MQQKTWKVEECTCVEHSTGEQVNSAQVTIRLGIKEAKLSCSQEMMGPTRVIIVLDFSLYFFLCRAATAIITLMIVCYLFR